MTVDSYLDSCPDCYSLNLDVKILNGGRLEVTCRDCGANWEDMDNWEDDDEY